MYLALYEASRDGSSAPGCAKGMYVIKQADKEKDFEDNEANYLELVGPTLACMGKGSDLLTQVLYIATTNAGSMYYQGSNSASVLALPLGKVFKQP